MRHMSVSHTPPCGVLLSCMVQGCHCRTVAVGTCFVRWLRADPPGYESTGVFTGWQAHCSLASGPGAAVCKVHAYRISTRSDVRAVRLIDTSSLIGSRGWQVDVGIESSV